MLRVVRNYLADISLVNEFVELTTAGHAFKASLAVIATDDAMLGALLDIKA